MRPRLIPLAVACAALATAVVPASAQPSRDVAQPRIIGGQVATVNPGLVTVGPKDGHHTCTGSLISPDWVLIASHCFKSEQSRPFVRIGSLKYAEGGETRGTAQIIFGHGNDLALLKLDAPVTTVAPVRLATEHPALRSVVTTWGWGYPQREAPASDVLKYCTNDVMSLGGRDGKGGVALMLTGGDGVAWKGDSGGPAFTAEGIQVGVASTSSGQMGHAKMSYYTSVAQYRSWIQETSGV